MTERLCDRCFKPTTGHLGAYHSPCQEKPLQKLKEEGKELGELSVRMSAIEPDYFSWVAPGVLAGAAYPHCGGHLQFMLDHGIRYLVTLTEWIPVLPLKQYPDIKWIHMPIPDERAPQIDQIVQLLDIVEKAKENNQKVLIHCEWGMGRTGVMSACYFVKCGMSAAAAIHKIRQLRPYSIETRVQEKVVEKYEKFLKKVICNTRNETDI